MKKQVPEVVESNGFILDLFEKFPRHNLRSVVIKLPISCLGASTRLISSEKSKRRVITRSTLEVKLAKKLIFSFLVDFNLLHVRLSANFHLKISFMQLPCNDPVNSATPCLHCCLTTVCCLLNFLRQRDNSYVFSNY